MEILRSPTRAAYAQGFHLHRDKTARQGELREERKGLRAKRKVGRAKGRSQKAIDFPTMSDREEMDLVLLQVECVNDSIVAHSQTEPL